MADSRQSHRSLWINTLAVAAIGSESEASDWLNTKVVGSYVDQTPFSKACATDEGFFAVAEHLAAIELARFEKEMWVGLPIENRRLPKDEFEAEAKLISYSKRSDLPPEFSIDIEEDWIGCRVRDSRGTYRGGKVTNEMRLRTTSSLQKLLATFEFHLLEVGANI